MSSSANPAPMTMPAAVTTAARRSTRPSTFGSNISPVTVQLDPVSRAVGVVGVHVDNHPGGHLAEGIRFGGPPVSLADPRHPAIAPNVTDVIDMQRPEREVAEISVARDGVDDIGPFKTIEREIHRRGCAFARLAANPKRSLGASSPPLAKAAP